MTNTTDTTIGRRGFLSGSAAMAGLLATGSLGALTLTGCDPTSSSDNERLTDFIWTYAWPCPRAVYVASQKKIYVGGTTSTGMVSLATFDLTTKTASRVGLVDHQADDHDTPAMLFEPDQKPLIVVADHGRTAYAEQWKGAAPNDVSTLTPSQITWGGPPSYGNLVRKPGSSTVAAIFRGGVDAGQYAAVSTDWGNTWGAPVRMWGGNDYGTHKISADGKTLWMATALNPTNPSNQVRVFQIDLASGVIKNAFGTRTSVQNLWALTGPITSAEQTYAVSGLVAPHALRLFDITNNGDVAIARWDDPDPAVSYRLLRRGASTYTEEVLCSGGVSFGYSSSHYVGGVTFDSDANHLVLSRESAGTWTYERWTCSAGTWSSDVLLTRTAASGHKLARPIVPRGAEGLGYTLVLDISKYSDTRYTDYLADARLVRDLGAYSAT